MNPHPLSANVCALSVIVLSPRADKLAGVTGHFFAQFFAMQCAAYKLLDRINRSWFQTLFYTNYKGRHASFKRPFAEFVHREYLRPRVRPQAREEVARLKREGYIVVLVTGSLDFLVRPLAMALGADVLIGARLEEDVHAVLTGRLDGEPVSDEEKAVRMRELAEDKGIDLQQSTAFGDGFADLPMLEAVGEPVAVNSDGRLASVARKRGWRTVRWAEPDGPRGQTRKGAARPAACARGPAHREPAGGARGGQDAGGRRALLLRAAPEALRLRRSARLPARCNVC